MVGVLADFFAIVACKGVAFHGARYSAGDLGMDARAADPRALRGVLNSRLV